MYVMFELIYCTKNLLDKCLLLRSTSRTSLVEGVSAVALEIGHEVVGVVALLVYCCRLDM